MFIRIKYDDNLDLINTDNILYITRNKHLEHVPDNVKIILKENKIISFYSNYEKFLESFELIIDNCLAPKIINVENL